MTNNPKMPKRIIRSNKTKIRLSRPKTSLKQLLTRLISKKTRRRIKESATNKKIIQVAPQPLVIIPNLSLVPIKKIQAKSSVITTLKRAIFLGIILSQKGKKRVIVLLISILVTISLDTLQKVFPIQYPVQFQGDIVNAIINFDIEIIAIILAYMIRIGFAIRSININVQKIDGLDLKTCEIIIIGFYI